MAQTEVEKQSEQKRQMRIMLEYFTLSNITFLIEFPMQAADQRERAEKREREAARVRVAKERRTATPERNFAVIIK